MTSLSPAAPRTKQHRKRSFIVTALVITGSMIVGTTLAFVLFNATASMRGCRTADGIEFCARVPATLSSTDEFVMSATVRNISTTPRDILEGGCSGDPGVIINGEAIQDITKICTQDMPRTVTFQPGEKAEYQYIKYDTRLLKPGINTVILRWQSWQSKPFQVELKA